MAGMFFVAITNAILLNKGLAEFEAMFLVPNAVGLLYHALLKQVVQVCFPMLPSIKWMCDLPALKIQGL